MEVIVGKTAGFCYGVKRAVEGAINELNKDSKIYCLGEIVHNKDVVKTLEKLGMRFIEDIKQAKRKVVIRAHGVAKKIYKEAKKSCIEVLDYTCPNVLKIHGIAQKYADDGYYIFLVGTKKHPENIGTISYCGKNLSVIEEVDDTFKAIGEFKTSKINKLLVIAQTTYSVSKFVEIENIIKQNISKNIKFEIKNTICKATEMRQKETEKISKMVDCMIIIGGKNSSNTKKLYDIAEKNCKQAILIENVKELDFELLEDKEKIGIMAGASTPSNSIEEVHDSLVKECAMA